MMFTAALLYVSSLMKFEVIEGKCDLRVKRVLPKPPRHLSLYHVSEDHVVVTWDPSADHGTRPVMYYVVYVKNASTVWTKVQSVTSNSNGVHIGELNPNETYQVSVRAVSKHGTGNASKPLLITTMPLKAEKSNWDRVVDYLYAGAKNPIRIVVDGVTHVITAARGFGKKVLVTTDEYLQFFVDKPED